MCRCAFWYFRPDSATGSWPNLAQMSKTAVFRYMSLNGLELFLTEGHRDLVIASNERYCCEDVPFDNFGQIWPPKNSRIRSKYSKVVIFQNMSIYEIFNTPSDRKAVGAFSCYSNTYLFSKLQLVRARALHMNEGREGYHMVKCSGSRTESPADKISCGQNPRDLVS